MSLFTIVNGKIQVDPDTLTIPELRQIYERNKDKEISLKELAYVYHMSDYKSPYSNLDESERKTQILKDYEVNDDSLLNEAIIKYKLLSTTPSMRLLEAAKKGTKKIEEFVSTVDLEEKDLNGKLLYKATELSTVLGNLGKQIESLAKLEEQVKKEIASGTKIRGNKEIGMFER